MMFKNLQTVSYEQSKRARDRRIGNMRGQTKSFKKSKNSLEKWWLVNAQGQTLGRIATQIASILRGKDKPTYTPHTDMGDFVIVINASQVHLTGQKLSQKLYYTRSRYFGSLKQKTAEKVLQSQPEKILYKAVRGMLPKNKLSRKILKKLKLYQGAEHPHQAQKPEALTLT